MEKKDPATYKRYTFTLVNLYILLISLLMIVLGYLLMSGGTSPDGVRFNPEVFSSRRITVAPMITTLGYLGVLVAIFYRSRSKSS